MSQDSSPAKPTRKRKRIVISCTECHRRKQKCDRAFPCSNCVARNKESVCHYENESARKQQLLEEKTNGSSQEDRAYGGIKLESDSAAQVSAFGYAKSNGNNNTTLGIFKKIESHEADLDGVLPQPAMSGVDHSGLREKYKSLIRQLPSKTYIEKLLPTYFREVNYHYYPLDEGTFRDLLKSWYSLSFSTLNKGPLQLPGDLQFFPALLFQILALALQFEPPDYDPSLDSLKYAASMSFDDLASDYSESGVSILNLLGKRHTTLVTVQAGFLRTAYLKNCGMVPESWHSLSSSIRDAQEIGLHKVTIDRGSRKPNQKPEDILESLWIEQLRRRMWTILSLWDIHMAIVLGRPTTIDPRDGKPAFPIDAPIPQNRREVAPAPRTDLDPPTPLTMLLWTAEIAAPLWDIFNLEKEDPHQNNFAKVKKMHLLINQITLHCPPYFRAENPDTTFDSHPECYWLSRARPGFQNGAAFTIMALHRPYIFTNSTSRTAALRAGLDILRAQRKIFNLLAAKDYKLFSLVLNTFDAIVLVAAIYILHPYENREDLDDTLQHYEWAMERFETMRDRNSMASAALGVLKAIHMRLKKALGHCKPVIKSVAPTAQSTPSSTTNMSPPVPTPESYSTQYSNQNQYPNHHTSISSASTSSNSNSSQYTQPTISNLTDSTPPPVASAWDSFSGTVPIPQNFDFSSMAPLQPMHDLLYRDLSTIGDPQMIDPQLTNLGTTDMGLMDGSNAGWQFEGDFGNDSFWGFMNSYNP